MNLNEFSQLIVKTPEEGRHLLNLILGFSYEPNNSPKALIALYSSFPEEIRKNDQTFASFFYKLFSKYELNYEYLSYFEKFNNFWNPTEREEIKNKYRNIFPQLEEKTFKNSLEFCKAFSTYKNNINLVFEFIDKQENCISNLILKNKSKFIENMHKHNCWGIIIAEDYGKFVEFCKDHQINHFNILKKEYVESYYGFKYFLNSINDKKALDLFKDLEEEPSFFDGSCFFSPNDKKINRNQPNVFQIAVICLSQEKHKSFSYLYKKYSQEIEQCMEFYSIGSNQEKLSSTNSQDWIKCIEVMTNNTKHSYHKEPFNEWECNSIFNKFKHNQIIDSILLNEELSHKKESKTKPIKI